MASKHSRRHRRGGGVAPDGGDATRGGATRGGAKDEPKGLDALASLRDRLPAGVERLDGSGGETASTSFEDRVEVILRTQHPAILKAHAHAVDAGFDADGVIVLVADLAVSQAFAMARAAGIDGDELEAARQEAQKEDADAIVVVAVERGAMLAALEAHEPELAADLTPNGDAERLPVACALADGLVSAWVPSRSV